MTPRTIVSADNHIIEAKRACVLGKAWFLNHSIDDRPSCLIDGQPARGLQARPHCRLLV